MDDNNPLAVCPENIWGYRQNKPSLIVRDLERFGVSRAITLKILMARGVFKWFSVRRRIIKLKDSMKSWVKQAQVAKLEAKDHGNWRKYHEFKGYQKAMEDVRTHIRRLCHSERWTPVGFDWRSFAELTIKKEAD